MSISWESSEVRKLAADLGQAGPRVGKEVADVTRKHGKIMEGHARTMAPVLTGALQGSVSLTTGGDGRSAGMSATVDASIRYAEFNEYGTSKMAAQPFMGPALDATAPGYVDEMSRVASDLL